MAENVRLGNEEEEALRREGDGDDDDGFRGRGGRGRGLLSGPRHSNYIIHSNNTYFASTIP